MSHNIIKHIIPYNQKYSFVFVEEKLDVKHPVSDYYLKLSDSSINLLISLKWVEWGYVFFKNISDNLQSLENFQWNDLIDNSINKKIDIVDNNHLLVLDDKIIYNDDDFYNLLKNEYSLKVYDSNTKIHLKLKINLREYLILNNVLFPYFIK